MREHAYRSRASDYALEDGICIACMKCFHSRPHLAYHLTRDSPKCLQHLVAVSSPLSPGEKKDIDARDAKRKREAKKKGLEIRSASVPMVRVPGPLNLLIKGHEGE